MSRLCQADYLQIAEQLRRSRDCHDLAFIRLSPTDQLDLIAYFGLDDELTPETITVYRQQVSKADPSLPQRAGKALRRLDMNDQDDRLAVYGVARLDEALLMEVLSFTLASSLNDQRLSGGPEINR